MPDAINESPLERLQARLTYTFRSQALLMRAMTHLSFLQDHPDETESNQRLEFLGDSVLQLVLTHTLFELYPGDREGLLSKRRAALSKGAFLSKMSAEIGISECLRLGAGEEAAGGRTRASTLEDAFESLLGALYLDSDFTTVRRIILGLYGSLPDRLATVEDVENPKGRLQEMIQATHGNNALHYDTLGTYGEDHAKEYEMGVFLNERRIGIGRGPSKKAAEEAAARMALETLGNDGA
jgi:ribonuclease-3